MRHPPDYGPGLSPEGRRKFVRDITRRLTVGLVAIALFTVGAVALFGPF